MIAGVSVGVAVAVAVGAGVAVAVAVGAGVAVAVAVGAGVAVAVAVGAGVAVAVAVGAGVAVAVAVGAGVAVAVAVGTGVAVVVAVAVGATVAVGEGATTLLESGTAVTEISLGLPLSWPPGPEEGVAVRAAFTVARTADATVASISGGLDAGAMSTPSGVVVRLRVAGVVMGTGGEGTGEIVGTVGVSF